MCQGPEQNTGQNYKQYGNYEYAGHVFTTYNVQGQTSNISYTDQTSTHHWM